MKNTVKKLFQQDKENTKQEEMTAEEALRSIAQAYTTRNIIARGLLNGIFTAVGATVGFAMLILIISWLYSGLQNLPIINDFMDVTGLNAVVEYALQQSGQGDIEVSDTVAPVSTPNQ